MTPKQADFLAQANNQGGGEHDRARRPRTAGRAGAAAGPTGSAPRTCARSRRRPARAGGAGGRVRERQPHDHPATARHVDANQVPQGPEKIDRDIAMARLAAEIHLRSERYAKRPKRKFVSASTQEYAWAGYLRDWVDRVERVGNLNYPDEARRRRTCRAGGDQRRPSVATVAVERPRRPVQWRPDAGRGRAPHRQARRALASATEARGLDVLHVTRTWRVRCRAVNCRTLRTRQGVSGTCSRKPCSMSITVILALAQPRILLTGGTN